ncbi:MAG TPA: hypothetical protein VES93_10105, partial [Ornithinibacter sp.]|nr:hypothetical protein [Ornithinibacter sp.]
SPETAEELSQDVESPSNEWGGPPQDEPAAADDTDLTVADVAEDPVEERFDPTPARDWAADEGELLEEAHDRGERLEAERIELAAIGDDATSDDTAGDDAAGADTATGDPASDSSSEDPASGDPASGDPASEEPAAEEPTMPERAGRRISAFQELRDGGFGVGSAAPLDDGAQPLDHPVQAYRDTMTYRAPGDPGYDTAEPHVWFYDEGAAQRSGFHRADG